MIIKREYEVANPQAKARRKVSTRQSATRRATTTKRSKEGMAARETKKTRRAAPKAAKRRNPSPTARNAARRSYKPRYRRRKNPDMKPADMAGNALTALVALVATRQLPQMILGTKNTGWMGYAANAGAAIAVAMLASRFIGPQAYQVALIGGSMYLANRVISEQLSPIGQYLSLTGVGDAQAATNLAGIEPASYTYPTIRDAQGGYNVPPHIQQAIDASRAAATGVGGVDRYTNAYN